MRGDVYLQGVLCVTSLIVERGFAFTTSVFAWSCFSTADVCQKVCFHDEGSISLHECVSIHRESLSIKGVFLHEGCVPYSLTFSLHNVFFVHVGCYFEAFLYYRRWFPLQTVFFIYKGFFVVARGYLHECCFS